MRGYQDAKGRMIVYVSEKDHLFIKNLAKQTGVYAKTLYSQLMRHAIDQIRRGEKKIEDILLK